MEQDNNLEKSTERLCAYMNSLNTTDQLQSILSEIKIGLGVEDKPKAAVLIKNVFENKGFDCIGESSKELVFANQKKTIHVCLLDTNDLDLDNMELSCSEVLKYRNVEHLPDVAELLKQMEYEDEHKGSANSKRKKFTDKRHQNGTRRTFTKGYNNTKYTKSAHGPKNRGHNFKK